MTDAELLAACAAGGAHGRRAYAASVREFRRLDARWRQDHAERKAAEAVADTAEVVFLAAMLRCPRRALS